MAVKKITLSEVFKKDLRIVAYLIGSWAVGLAVIFSQTGTFPKEGWLLGIIPALNYIAYRIIEELKKEGYREALK
jgi:hypothetical protein